LIKCIGLLVGRLNVEENIYNPRSTIIMI